jgi:hypothetical protein
METSSKLVLSVARNFTVLIWNEIPASPSERRLSNDHGPPLAEMDKCSQGRTRNGGSVSLPTSRRCSWSTSSGEMRRVDRGAGKGRVRITLVGARAASRSGIGSKTRRWAARVPVATRGLGMVRALQRVNRPVEPGRRRARRIVGPPVPVGTARRTTGRADESAPARKPAPITR